MHDFNTLYRPYWAPDLNNVNVSSATDIKKWIAESDSYLVDHPLQTDSFILSVFSRNDFLTSVSIDCNRFNCAAIESISNSEIASKSPKSISWILLKQYYAAFYSAHSFLRLLGISLTQLEQTQINKIHRSAVSYGTKNNITLIKGYYRLDFSNNNLSLNGSKAILNSGLGSHKALWKTFGEELKRINNLTLSQGGSNILQTTIIKIEELLTNLQYLGSNNYSWLSRMRNEINYQHKHKTWFPFKLKNQTINEIKDSRSKWKSQIEDIELRNLTGKEIIRFSNTCQFIVGLNLTISKDMTKRCNKGKSFHKHGIDRIINVA